MDRMNLYLIGFMGVGKSTIAKELEKKLYMERIEMDEAIVQEQGMSIANIFETQGEEYFRDIESAFVDDLKKTQNKIVSCGGGAVLREKNSSAMKESGKIVLLTASPETIYERVKGSTARPVLNGNMDVEYIKELMEKRRPRYEEVADVRIETDHKSARVICDEIVAALL